MAEISRPDFRRGQMRRPRRHAGLKPQELKLLLLMVAVAAIWSWPMLSEKVELLNDRIPTIWTGAPLTKISQRFMQVSVVDGDTVRSEGQVYRLVGFNTPESGGNAKCAYERELSARATARLQELIADGGAQLERVPCACRAGTEGTKACNHGRLCGTLRVGGMNAGDILISEGLAEIYVCDATRCPPRKNWCAG